MITRHYGWRPELPDHRDLKLTLEGALKAPLFQLPPSADLRGPLMPAVYDQGALGSCTANAVGSALDFELARQGLPFLNPSRLMIYWNERYLEGTEESDSGATIRDSIKSLIYWGACSEAEWPYDPAQFTVKPGPSCYAAAAQHKLLKYLSITQGMLHFRLCLAAGFPFVFGFSVYESFESSAVASSGIVPMPAAGEKLLGGHAVKAVGYDDAAQMITVKNSWGDKWGQAGYFQMPYSYISNPDLADDFWSLRLEQ